MTTTITGAVPSSNIDINSIPQTTQDFRRLKYLLAVYVQEVKATRILEIGTDVGDTARIFSTCLQLTQGKLVTLDRLPPKDDWLANWPIQNLRFIQHDSHTFDWGDTLDLLWLDGDHTYEGVKQDVERFGKWVRVGGKILLHDTRHAEFGAGIVKVIREWTRQHELVWTEYPQEHGLGVIEVTHAIPQ